MGAYIGAKLTLPPGYTTCKKCNRVLEKKDADKAGLCEDCRPDAIVAPSVQPVYAAVPASEVL